MTGINAPKIALGVLASVVAVSAGIGAGAVVFTDATPTSLQSTATVTSAPVTERPFEDKRTVEVTLTLGTDTALTAPTSGRVTSLSCQAGGDFTSGATNLSIDGRRVLNLATSVPLWRDLVSGDEGEDVTALQEELVRLGYDVAVRGTVGPRTLAAVSDLFRKAGDTAFTTGDVPASRILWLPDAEVSVASCTAATGATIEEGGDVAALPGGLAAAAISRLPEGLAPGDRVLTVDGTAVPVDADGRVTSTEALATLEATTSYQQAVQTDATTLSGSYALAEPVTVSVVPPGALYDIDGGAACIASDGAAQPVQVVGSELGQSFITVEADAAPPGEVDLDPDGRRSCR